ncbi:Gldg family protein [Candidatus Halobeggiatoa sp. HSG11]|nr:Gldg family protein [Candidatus Halobeggiatoa sp. HSG11]
MQVTKKTHLQASLQNSIFTILLFVVVGLVAWLSNQYEIKADWTLNNRHSLSETSQKLLTTFVGPITITAYAGNDNNLRRAIKDLIERYQQYKSDISLRFVDPFAAPGEVRERGIKINGELIIDYQERSEHVQDITEQSITSALQRVARTEERLVVFLEGHGERTVNGIADHDLSQWASLLKTAGFKLQPLNFGQMTAIPANANVLVIPNPRRQLLPTEINLITDYIDNGGNLLWLIDPTVPLHGLENLADKFGLKVQPGMIVDPVSRFLGVNNPAIVSVTTTGYNVDHPITTGFEEYLTLFPQASGLIVEPPENWIEIPLLTSHPQAWSETGDMEGTVEYEPETDIIGPLNIAFALIHEDLGHDEGHYEDEHGHEIEEPEIEIAEVEEIDTETENVEEAEIESTQEQRIVIVGDGDFLSNAFLQYGGNVDLGIKMMNWLSEDDVFVNIPIKTAVDLSLDLSPKTAIFLGAFFLFILPITLISIGIIVWLKRRKA